MTIDQVSEILAAFRVGDDPVERVEVESDGQVIGWTRGDTSIEVMWRHSQEVGDTEIIVSISNTGWTAIKDGFAAHWLGDDPEDCDPVTVLRRLLREAAAMAVVVCPSDGDLRRLDALQATLDAAERLGQAVSLAPETLRWLIERAAVRHG